MAFAYETFTVANKPFKVMKMGGMTAAKMWPRLVRLIAGALERLPAGVAVALVDILSEDEDKDHATTFLLGQVGGIAGVFEEFCSRLPDAEMQAWMERLFEGGPGDRLPALYGGMPILDAMETGDVDGDAVWQCLFCALKVNYAVFRKGLAGAVSAGLAEIKKMAPTAEQSPATQVPPGDSAASTT